MIEDEHKLSKEEKCQSLWIRKHETGYSITDEFYDSRVRKCWAFSTLDELVKFIGKVKSKYDINVLTNKNLAKKIAKKVHKKIPVLVAAEFLMGALHVWRNQTSENSKQISVYYEIPELNHYLLEGMSFPKTNPKSLFFDSDDDRDCL